MHASREPLRRQIDRRLIAQPSVREPKLAWTAKGAARQQQKPMALRQPRNRNLLVHTFWQRQQEVERAAWTRCRGRSCGAGGSLMERR
jgi:hypothetical protein